MMVRPLVSYDDLSSPQEKRTVPPTAQPAPRPKQSKKRKRYAQQHWDDQVESRQPDVTYGEQLLEPQNESAERTGRDVRNSVVPDDESRELTHEEIWDDSALIDVWNAAMAEYEAFHGDSKGWKNEPVVRPALWYNVPPSSSKPNKQDIPPSHVTLRIEAPTFDHKENHIDNGDVELDSRPSDFNTFVPSHDPSLQAVASSTPFNAHTWAQSVSQDEAFDRALQAMYWSGYWTAVYHHTKAQPSTSPGMPQEEADYDGYGSHEEADE